MTDKQPDALRLAGLLELAPEEGVEPQTTEDAAAELRRQHTRIAELEARIKTMAEEHADELMVAHLDGRMRAAQPVTAKQPGELSEFVTITAAMRGERVEDIYRRAWDLLSLPARASHGQAPAGLAVPSMSADEVNALPTAARAYIHQLATNTDPAGMVRENMQLRDTNAGLQSMYRKAADAAQEVVGCFHAAECEGLQAALAGTADEHLKDLVERRLMHALYAAQEVAGQAPAQAAPDVSGYVSEWASGICTADEAMAGIAKLYGAQAAPTTQPAPQPSPASQGDALDTARLDWLDKNIFYREMSEWDAKYGHGSGYNMWVLFAPKGAQGSARSIIDAACAAQERK